MADIDEVLFDDGDLVVVAHEYLGRPALHVSKGGKMVASGTPRVATGGVLEVGRVSFAGPRGAVIQAAYDRWLATHGEAIAAERAIIEAESDRRYAADCRAADRIVAEARRPRLGVTGAEADIEATEPGGYAAWARGASADLDRTPSHPSDY